MAGQLERASKGATACRDELVSNLKISCRFLNPEIIFPYLTNAFSILHKRAETGKINHGWG